MNILQFFEKELTNKVKVSITKEKTVILPEKLYTSVDDLLTFRNGNLDHVVVRFSISENKISINSMDSGNGQIVESIQIHNKLACMLGFPQEKLSAKKEEDVLISLMKTNDDPITNNYTFEDVPNLEFSIPPWIFLYCDIVEPTNVGNLSVPILKIIPIQNKSIHVVNGTFTEFANLEYFPISVDSFQTINFQLHTHDGYLVQFNGDESVQLTLSFQKSI